MTWCRKQLHRAIAQQVVVAVDQRDLLVEVDVVDRQIKVLLDCGFVVPSIPLTALHDYGNRGRKQCQSSRVVVMEVCQDDLGDRVQLYLLGDALLELRFDRTHRVGPTVASRRILNSCGVEASVDENPLLRRRNDVGGYREAGQPIEGL